jgi:NurA-like 5'-3' nuclease
MLDITYETFARKRRSLKKQIDSLTYKEDLKKYGRYWRSIDFEGEKAVIGAEDGSINHKRYKSIVLYVVNATAVLYNNQIKEVKYSDIDILYPYKDIDERLSIYRSIFELKTSLQVIDEVELFLIDGSIFSDLIVPRNQGKWLGQEDRKEVMAFLPEIENSDEVEITSQKLARDLKGKDKFDKIAFLEYLEYLSCLEKLMEKGVNKLVGISKSSIRAEFKEGMPDMAIFEEVTSSSGYSQPFFKFLPKRFPVYREFFKNFVFTTFYARLEDKKGVLMLETPREIGEEEIVKILSRLRSISVDGYPYLLRKAHKSVVIADKDMQRIASSLGIAAKTGREMLEW